MEELSNGLRNQISHLEDKLLKRSDLTEAQRAQVSGLANTARKLLSIATKAFTPHGDI